MTILKRAPTPPKYDDDGDNDDDDDSDCVNHSA